MATLEVRNLRRSFDHVEVLSGASFRVEDGHIVAILGPSGCGKTTALRIIAGLDEPNSGDVLLDGASVLGQPPHRRGVGLMFQDLALFPHMTVADNIAFGPRMARWPRPLRQQRVQELLQLVGLQEMAERGVHELSGGERQRVALARTLAPDLAVLLLDEPLGSLDETLKAVLRGELRELLKRLQTTALFVSHDLRDAAAIADDLIVMSAGRVLQQGPLEQVVDRPATPEVAHMLGYVTLIVGLADGHRVVEAGVGSLTFTPPATGPVELLAHPSTLRALPVVDSGGLNGLVQRVQRDGPGWTLQLSIGPRTVALRWEHEAPPPAIGQLVAVAVPSSTLRVFAQPGGSTTL